MRDIPYGDIDSSNPPTIMGYWSDWGVYDNGSYGVNKYLAKDLVNKSKNVNVLAYSFMETQPDGTLYFFDPWSDLRPSDAKDFECKQSVTGMLSFQMGNLKKR